MPTVCIEQVGAGRRRGGIPGAARFDGSASYLGAGDNTTLNVAGGGTPALLFGCWVKLHSKATNQFVMGKWSTAATGSCEYGLWYDHTLDRFIAGRLDAFGVPNQLVANTYGSPPLETWLHVGAKLAGGSVQWQIWVNGAESDFMLPGEAAGTMTGKSEFRIGLTADGAWPLNADIDDAFVENDPFPVPDFSVPYNAGAGSAYRGLSGDFLAGLTAWFNCDEATPAQRIDSVHGVSLTPHGTVAYVTGKT